MADISPDAQDSENPQQLDNAIRALHEKKPLPEIDFTLHTMEDGSQVSTLDRVCKGERRSPGARVTAAVAGFGLSMRGARTAESPPNSCFGD